MHRRLIHLIIKNGLPVLTGQFLYDWFRRGFPTAVINLPIRVAVMMAILSAWWAFREYRERKKTTLG